MALYRHVLTTESLTSQPHGVLDLYIHSDIATQWPTSPAKTAADPGD